MTGTGLYTYKNILILMMICTACLGFSSCGSVHKPLNNDYKSSMSYLVKGIKVDDTVYKSQISVDYYTQGATYEHQGRYAEAILEYNDALKYDSSATIYYSIAKCYLELQKNRDAMEFAVKSLSVDSLFVPSIKLIADQLIAYKDFSTALSLYKQIVDLDPSRDNRLTLALLYQSINPDKSVEMMNNLLKESEDVFVLMNLRLLYERMNKPDSVLKTLQRIEKVAPSNFNNSILLLSFYLKQRDFKNAFEYLNNINNRFQPLQIGEALIEFADSIFPLKKDSAKSVIEEFLPYIDNRFYTDWRIQILTGELYMIINENQKADFTMNHVLDLADSVPQVPVYIAYAYDRQHLQAKGLEIAQKYQVKYPDSSSYDVVIATCYYNMKAYNEAVVKLKSAIVKNPGNINYYAFVGNVYDKMNKPDSAAFFYKTALSISPDDPTLNNDYAYNLSQRGVNLEEALKLINIALQAEPDNSSFLDTYGWIQYKLGNYDIALEYCLKAFSKGALSEEIYQHLGAIYIKKGEKDKALDIINKGLKEYPDYNPLKDQLNEIK